MAAALELLPPLLDDDQARRRRSRRSRRKKVHKTTGLYFISPLVLQHRDQDAKRKDSYWVLRRLVCSKCSRSCHTAFGLRYTLFPIDFLNLCKLFEKNMLCATKAIKR